MIFVKREQPSRLLLNRAGAGPAGSRGVIMRKPHFSICTLFLLALSSVPAVAEQRAEHGQRNLRVQQWHGDKRQFHRDDFRVWRGGHWFHGPHAGRDGGGLSDSTGTGIRKQSIRFPTPICRRRQSPSHRRLPVQRRLTGITAPIRLATIRMCRSALEPGSACRLFPREWAASDALRPVHIRAPGALRLDSDANSFARAVRCVPIRAL